MINRIRHKFMHPLFIAAFFCVVLYGLGLYCRPLFPVDETRYLTVAWEMFSGEQWILLHLNHEAYDHKPPLLFWMIGLIWSIFGVSDHAAMAVPFIFAFCFAAVTYRLAKKLLPEQPHFPALVTYIMIGSLPFIVYSNMIMFDLLLGVFSVLGLTAIWDYAHNGEKRHLCLLALAVGLGGLAKGPVILLHIIFPLIAMRYWNPPSATAEKFWAAGIGISLAAGICLVLCWAIPAALMGGKAFTERLFWGQTAGRVTNSFDHEQPFWWYLPFLPLFLLPWAFSPLFWRGGLELGKSENTYLLRFLVSWIVPLFVCFCFISGKQVHYLLPLMPGLAVFFALAFSQSPRRLTIRDAVFPFSATGFLILLPLILKSVLLDFPQLREYGWTENILSEISLTFPIILFIVSAFLVFKLGVRTIKSYILCLSFSSLLVMVCFQLEARDGLFKNYDLRPIAEIIQKNPNTPLAFTRNYHGEWGYLARLRQPVTRLRPEELKNWLDLNPDALALVRTSKAEEVKPYDILFSMPYKFDNTYYVVVKRGQADRFER